MNLHSSISSLLHEQPNLSYGELHDILCDQGWLLDSLSVEQRRLAYQIPGWKALFISSATAEISARQSQSFSQLIPTGETFCRDQFLSFSTIANLLSLFEDHILICGDAPLFLSRQIEDPSMQLAQILVDIAKSVIAELAHDSLLSDHNLLGEPMVLLMNRCLLRRTYPCNDISPSLKNKNNQDWHQDSNIGYGARPMLTLWIPLHEDSGFKVPGIEISSLRPNSFSAQFGDGVEDLLDLAKNFSKSTVSSVIPRLSAGGYAVFNGLTYHRTYVNDAMTGPRDALLVRLAPLSYVSFFPGDRSKDIELGL